MLEKIIEQLNIKSGNIIEITHSKDMQILSDYVCNSQFIISKPLSYIPTSLFPNCTTSFISIFIKITNNYLDKKFKYIMRDDLRYGCCVIIYHEDDNKENIMLTKYDLKKIKKLKAFL